MAELFFRDDGKWEKAPGTGHGEERISQIQQILKSRSDALRVSYPEAVVRELALQIYIAAQRCRFRKEVEFDPAGSWTWLSASATGCGRPWAYPCLI